MGAQWKVRNKEVAASVKGRIFTKLSKEIMVAARAGADPDMNPRLRMAIEQAKKASVPKDTVERAIKKGAGLVDEGVSYEKVTYEGFAPHRVPVIRGPVPTSFLPSQFLLFGSRPLKSRSRAFT